MAKFEYATLLVTLADDAEHGSAVLTSRDGRDTKSGPVHQLLGYAGDDGWELATAAVLPDGKVQYVLKQPFRG